MQQNALNRDKFVGNFLLALVVAFASSGCQTSPISTSGSNSTSASTNANSDNSNLANKNDANSTLKASYFPITMAVIDAMFTDESFSDKAKSAAQLTDAEIDKIQNAARNDVLQLSGDPAENETRSTRASTAETQQKIESLVGQQKSVRFIDFVRSQWAGESAAIPSAAPNSLPNDTRVVVNSPAYRMDIFKDGKLIKTYKVGIGYPEFPLPTGLRHANEIIFNPTWTPPDEPWVKGKFQPGKTVEAGSKLNPLGPIKIPIGLPSLIHGGKDPSRLGTFASHGCVGLTNSMIHDFAIQLASIGGASLTTQEIKEYEKAKDDTKIVKLPDPVPVELRYETIVVEDGKVHIFRDVYERGTNTEENLRRVLDVYGIAFDQLDENEQGKLKDALVRMAVDARGNDVTDNGNDNSTNTNSAKVTRNIKGPKEVVVEIGELKGKGYPVPVDFSQK